MHAINILILYHSYIDLCTDTPWIPPQSQLNNLMKWSFQGKALCYDNDKVEYYIYKK